MQKQILKFISISAIILLSFCTQLIYANGDPVVQHSSVIKAGNPIPKTITDIQIVKENLYVQPTGIYTNVKVEYVLNNCSDNDHNSINYGFPVDYSGSGMNGFVGDYVSESIYQSGWADYNIKNIAFFINGKSLDYSSSDSIVTPSKKEYNEDFEDTITTEPVSRRWYYTHFQIKKKSITTLTITYTLFNKYSTALYGFDSSILGKYFPYNKIQFHYDFSPAQHWGNGTIDDFNVIVDFNLIQFTDINKLNINGLPLVQKDKLYTYHTNNFNLKNSKPLDISFNNPGGLPSFYELAQNKLNNNLYQISTCSETKAYPASNLIDTDLETAWVPEHIKAGDSIVITMKKPTYLTDILLYNGYQKNETLWEQNGSLSKIKVDILWDDDEMNTYNIHYNNTFSLLPSDQKYEWVDLKLNEFRHPMILNITPVNVLPWIKDYDVHNSKIKKVKITILETKPGTKYKDICVSEILLLGFDPNNE